MVVNGDPGRPDGKCHRKHTAREGNSEKARQEITYGQTSPRQDGPSWGWQPLEPAGNRGSRQMTVLAAIKNHADVIVGLMSRYPKSPSASPPAARAWSD